ncbi:MAG TPA: hypothetical protein VL360_02880 [Gammaproteobacteria bacterium]|jgi:hypothetical protein|nr:hypothetical protein [Gammaproteobacteria bacterium]
MFRSTQVDKKPSGKYWGLQGLNTDLQEFENYVMHPDVVRNFFAGDKHYEAAFAYPKAVEDGFGESPIFSQDVATAEGMLLQAKIHSNSHPASCLTFFANLLLPKSYTAKDEVRFVTDEANGFGEGTVRITTRDCLRDNNKEAWLARHLIAVRNRPGVFLHVTNDAGEAYDNIAIFFPAQATGLTHSPVKNGEAFVLVQQGAVLTDAVINDIKNTFDKLVKKSYGNDNGLYSVNSHMPVEQCISSFYPSIKP